MADVHTQEIRSRNMAAIKGKNTKPELLIRRGLHARGYRFRLHYHRLPGKPDLVFPKYRAVIFVNGCFWHLHDCPLFKWPSSRAQFWKDKLTKSKDRDARTLKMLRDDGWRVLKIWECALKGSGKMPLEEVLHRAESWLRSKNTIGEVRETVSRGPVGGAETLSLH